MPITELILQSIAEKVISYVLDKSQVRIEEWVGTKLGLDSTQQAFKHALGTAIEKFEQLDSQWAASLFNADFFRKEGAPILAQFLIRDGHPDPSKLAALWADSLNIHQSEPRTILTREIEPAAANFLDYLAQALKAEPELREVNDSRALERLTIDLEAIRDKLGAEKATPGTRRDYLHWLIERKLYIDPRGTFQTHRQVQLRLNDVYIWLRAHYDEMLDAVDQDLGGTEQELYPEMANKSIFTKEMDTRREQLPIGPESSSSKPIGDGQSEILELSEIIKRHDRLIILGEPGSGKTTLLRYLALKHAQAMWNGQLEAGTVLGPTHFPIRIRVADYAERGMPNGTSLTDFLADYCIMRECPKTGLADLLAAELDRGNCLILIDGLDEIVSADVRRSAVQQIEDFVRRHGARPNRFIITSRIAGYTDAPLSGSFAQYTIREMDDEQIHHFLELWCNAVEDAQTPEVSIEARRNVARREFEGILNAIYDSPGVRRFAANPLLLRILALIHRTGARLPQKRIELYRLAADTLTRTWRPAQGVPESALTLIKDEYLTPLLGKLAYWLHVHKPTALASEREVYEVLGAEWADLNDLPWDVDRPNPKIKAEVDKFLVAVREHTGIFVERAPNRYGFMHLTFEEYYAARYLIARSKTRARLIRKHLHDPRWDEPILLALGLVGLESPIEASALLETAILAEGEDAKEFGFTSTHNEILLGRDYLFTLRCLGDQIPAQFKLVRPLIKRLADEMLHRTGSARFQRYRLALEERLRHLKGSEGASELFPLLLAALDDPDFKIRLRAVQSMEQLGLFSSEEMVERFSSEVIEALLKVLFDHDFNVRYAAAQNLRQLGRISSEVITALLNSLCENDARLRLWAAESLGQLGQASDRVITALLSSLGDDDPDVRCAAVESLGQLGQASDRVITALLDSLRSRDISLRYHAAHSLRQLNLASDVVVTALLGALHDPDHRVRHAAAQSLGFLKQGQASDEVVTALLRALYDPVPWVRVYAVESLARLGRVSREVIDVLLNARSDDDYSVRRAALQSLRQLVQVSDEVTSILLITLRDPDSRVRRSSAESLGLLEQEQASSEIVKALLITLCDPDQSVRRQAVESLGHLGKETPEVLTALTHALKDPVPLVREAAAKSLEKCPITQEALATLTRALDDASLDVCYQAAISLGKLGEATPNIEAMLLKALQSAESWSIRRDAALLLGQLGQISTIQILLHGLLDRYNLVRAACAQALAHLGQRFPNAAERIATKLAQATEDPEFDRPDDSVERRSAHDYAFDGLWQLMIMKSTS